MKSFYLKTGFLIMGACFVFCGCGADKPSETEEKTNLSAETSAVPTKDKKSKNNLLNAPANYIKTSIGQIEKAKKASGVYEKSSLEHMDIPEENN